MPPSLRCPSLAPSTACAKQLCRASQTSRSFSTTPRNDQRVTRARRRLFAWLNTQGAALKNPLPGSTNYLGAYNKEGRLTRVVQAEREAGKTRDNSKTTQKDNPSNTAADGEKKEKLPKETVRDLAPFPLNRQFISQPVLTSKFQEHIWSLVIKEGKSVREVSAEVGVEMSRVAAVVRLLEVENEWKKMNKPLAMMYHNAVQSMLPKTDWNPEQTGEENRRRSPRLHESINDLPVHAATGQQIFLPTAESRHFTRADAAKAFDEKLLPADARVPHPELAIMHREVLDGLTPEERQKRAEAREAIAERRRAAALAREVKKEASTKRVDIGRFEYRFTEIKVDDAGKDGRGLKGVGWRYGAPLMDRSRAQHKIPSAVE